MKAHKTAFLNLASWPTRIQCVERIKLKSYVISPVIHLLSLGTKLKTLQSLLSRSFQVSRNVQGDYW